MMMLATVLLVTADRSCCWLTAGDESGMRRLYDPDDYVRQEVASALAS